MHSAQESKMINNGYASMCFGASRFVMIAFTILIFVFTYLNTMSRTKQGLQFWELGAGVAATPSGCEPTGEHLGKSPGELPSESSESSLGESFEQLSTELSSEIATQLHTHG